MRAELAAQPDKTIGQPQAPNDGCTEVVSGSDASPAKQSETDRHNSDHITNVTVVEDGCTGVTAEGQLDDTTDNETGLDEKISTLPPSKSERKEHIKKINKELNKLQKYTDKANGSNHPDKWHHMPINEIDILSTHVKDLRDQLKRWPEYQYDYVKSLCRTIHAQTQKIAEIINNNSLINVTQYDLVMGSVNTLDYVTNHILTYPDPKQLDDKPGHNDNGVIKRFFVCILNGVKKLLPFLRG